MNSKILVFLCVLVIGLGGIAFSRTTSAQDDVKILDRCCFDLDGGGDADDGIFVISRGGTEILVAIIYEDPDKDKKFDDRDIVRAVLVAPATRQ